MRIIRLFSILDKLRVNRHPISAKTLAKSLHVSERTIYRDMATLQSMGAPVRGEGGIGYQMEKGYFLPPLHFDSDELDAIILGMELIASRSDDVLANAARRATAKINDALSEDKREAFKNAPLQAFSQTTKTRKIPFLSIFRKAVRKRQCIDLTYLDLKKQTTQRTIRPLGLTVFDKAWLLTAWCEKKNDFRNFRVDRVQSAAQTDKTFPRETGKEFNDFLKTL
ncbi:MAG: DNA-binding transcriptional regulator [Rhodospirillaceae bacterium]|nr:MAG: DNA-binding transcriptional regulator [Rhodospirillaceae bacterium]